MSKASDELKDRLGIHNPHGACTFASERGGVGVYLDYRPEDRGRAYQSAAWQVVRPGFQTDPDGHWRNYGHKTFGIYGRDQRAKAEGEAREWASERYGVEEWVKIPGLSGALYPKGDAEIVKAALREARKAEV